MVIIKTAEHIAAMRRAGKILKETLDLLREAAKPGVTTKELDDMAYDFIVGKNDAAPSFLNYGGFPASVCTSIDEEVVHGIPSEKRVLEEGMLLKLDCGVKIGGYHTDAARTVGIGRISREKQKLLEVTEQSFFEGMKVLKSGVRLGTLGSAIQSYAEKFGFSVVRDLVGHGVGADLHEEPNVPNYGTAGRGLRLFAGMTIAVEPMINAGSPDVCRLSDGWTVVTEDGKPSAHYENTLVITDDGVEILTL